MKKVLALVLAVMMMATVAFAADVTLSGSATGTNASFPKTVLPGGKVEFNDSGLNTLVPGLNASAINSTNYSLSKVKWDEGRNLVESVKFDDANDKVVVKIKQDYTLTTQKKLVGEITLKGKRVNKTKIADIVIDIDTTVGYTLADGTGSTPKIQINGITGDADPTVGTFDADDQYLWKVVKGTDASGKDVTYGTLDFDAADDSVNVEVRVYDGDKLYLYSDVDADTDILKAYADTDADITFLNFPGNPTFNATATIRFYKDEGTYIYANNDGKLSRITAASAGAAGQTAGNVTWDDDEGCYILKTRTLGSYVFSDKALNVTTSAAPSTTNPDTGANDVVGVATALAAVALVSAAAVSLKK